MNQTSASRRFNLEQVETAPERRHKFINVLLLVLFLSLFTQTALVRGQNSGHLPNADLLSEFRWRLLGPASPAGRVWQVVGVESDPKTFYVTTAGGGLWKSTDNGTTLLPIFDKQTSASTGAVAIARSNPNIVRGRPAMKRWRAGVSRPFPSVRLSTVYRPALTP